MSWRTHKSRWLFVLLWATLTVALALTLPSLPWRRVLTEVRQINAAWVGAAVVANLLVLPLWATEWRLLVPDAFRVSYARMLEIVAVTAAVLNSIPFFAGEASAVALLMSRGGLTSPAALSVLALDQLLVGFAKVAVLAAAAWLMPLPDWLRAGVLSLVLGVFMLMVLLVPLAHRWSSVRERLLRHRTTLRDLVSRIVAWGTHLDALRHSDRVWRLVLLALAKKAAELAAVIAMQVAFGMEPSMAGALLVVAALAITTLIPAAPGNLGVYEATVFASYRLLGVPSEIAVGIAIVQHMCVLLPNLAAGYLALTLRQLRPDAVRAS